MTKTIGRQAHNSKSLLVLALTLVTLALGSSSALAAESAPQWTVTAVSLPTNFAPGAKAGEDSYRVILTNTGGAATDGTPIQVTDDLPAGLSLDPAGASGEDTLTRKSAGFSCVLRSCTYTGAVVPDQALDLTFPVDVSPGAASELTNVVRVAGGGAPDAAVKVQTAISEQPAGFGISPGGAATTLSTAQAGAHPDITNSIAFNTVNSKGDLAGNTKDVVFDLPTGFAGDLVDTPSCPAATFTLDACPVGTQIGVTVITLSGVVEEPKPVYNLAPDPGEVAKLGFRVSGFFIQGGVFVRPGDNGLRVVFANINQSLAELDNASLTVWGVPADKVHDPLRRPFGAIGGGGASSDAARAPFFTNATSCGTQPLHSEFHIDSWQQPGQTVEEHMSFGPLVGCDRLAMEPSLTAEATSDRASSATGLQLNLHIPQTYENPDGLATSTLKRAVVTLPEGMTVNPSAGAGLGACTRAEYEEEPLQASAGVGCPNNSLLGTIKIVTPSLKEEVTGSVYLAQPYENQFGSLLALYVIARIPDRGLLVKFAGQVQANPLTGQLVTTFDDLPPLPFSLSTFRFNQGATAPLVTPPACGSYAAQASLTPWANPSQVLSPLIPAFPISSAFDGGPCPSGGAPPFNPRVITGTQDNSAGSYSPFYLRLVREDGEQEITRFSTIMPPGLTGNLSGIPFCPEAAIEAARARTGAQEEAEPSCPAASQIGHTLVGAGVGSVLAQTPGRLYLAGPYHGAPLSLVSVTYAKVGPFDLGTVVIRFALRINPITAQVEVDATGSDPIPHIIRGIVVHVRDIRAYIDRQSFIINPTSCEHLQIQNTITGAGADPANPADQVRVNVTSPFQAANCQNLAFKPLFKVSTSGKTSRANGASLTVKLTYPIAPVGTQANIAKVKVDLPKQLPSRLTTLQKACTAAQFNTNPAGCPAASFIGHAKAVTPILPVPLEGPAIFVSHGGEAFPSLEIVLQGYGVTIDLVGSTFISKAGITSSTFKTVPDQPVTSFELTLPEGKFSALAANGNLCTVTKTVTVKKKLTVKVKGKKKTVTRKVKETKPESLAMPTEFVGQNGAVIHQSTPVSVTGCAKVVRHERKKKHTKKKKK
jgi:hypothetical protein